MQSKSLDSLISRLDLSYGNKIRIHTIYKNFNPIYIITPHIQISLDKIFKLQNYQVERLKDMNTQIKNYSKIKLQEVKNYKNRHLDKNDPYTLVGDSQLYLFFKDKINLQIQIYNNNKPIVFIGSQQIYNGDCVYVICDDMYLVQEQGMITSKSKQQTQGLWIINQIMGNENEIELQNCLQGGTVQLIKQIGGWIRKVNQKSDIRDSKLLRIESSRGDLRKSIIKKHYNLIKGNYCEIRLQNEFKYLKYKLNNYFIQIKSLSSDKYNKLIQEQLLIINQKIKQLILKKFDHLLPNPTFVNPITQYLLLKYNILYLLFQIFKILQIFLSNLTSHQKILSSILQIFYIASFQNQSISLQLYPVLDHFIKSQYTDILVNNLIFFIKNHRTLLNYFHIERDLGIIKNQYIVTPIQYIIDKILTTKQQQIKTNSIKILINICYTQQKNIFLNQQAIFRNILNERVGRKSILYKIYAISQKKIMIQNGRIGYQLGQLSKKALNKKQENILLGNFQDQINLCSSLCKYRNKECILYFKKKNKQLIYYLQQQLKGNIKLALIRSILQTQTHNLQQYDINMIRILQEKSQRKTKYQRISFTSQLPKQMIVEEFNKDIFMSINNHLTLYYKHLQKQIDHHQNIIFSKLLLQNIRLTIQMLLQKNLNIRQKKQSLLKKYFKNFFSKINILKRQNNSEKSETNNVQLDHKNQYLQISTIVSVLLKIFAYSPKYNTYLKKFKVKYNKITNDVDLKDETIKGIKKIQKMFKRQSIQINISQQIKEENLIWFKASLSKIEFRYNKINIIRNMNSYVGNNLITQEKHIQGQKYLKFQKSSDKHILLDRQQQIDENQYLGSDKQDQELIKTEICKFLNFYIFAKIQQNINLAFQQLEISYKQNQKFFKKKQKFYLTPYLPDFGFYKIFDKDLQYLLLQQFYLASDPKLINQILSILRNLSSTATIFSQIVNSIIIISQRQQCLYYTSLKGLLQYLKQISSNCENWLRIDMGNYQFYLKQMHICMNLLHSININLKKLLSINDQQQIKIYQKILFNLDIFPVLFDIVHYIQSLYHSKQQLVQLQIQQVGLSKQILRQSLNILKAMMYKNTSYQEMIYEMFFENLFQTYNKFGSLQINFFFQAIFFENYKLLLKLGREQLQEMIFDFIRNANFFENILKIKDNRVKDRILKQINDIMCNNMKCMKKINLKIDKQQKEEQFHKGKRQNRSVQLIERKIVLYRILIQITEMNKILPEQLLESIEGRISKDLCFYQKQNKRKYDEKPLKLKIYLLELIIQLLHQQKITNINVQIFFLNIQNYFKSQFILQLNCINPINLSNLSNHYLLFYFSKIFPSFIIFINNAFYKYKFDILSSQTVKIIDKLIDKQTAHQQILNVLIKTCEQARGLDISVIIRYFKNIINSQQLQHFKQSQILQIFYRNIQKKQEKIAKQITLTQQKIVQTLKNVKNIKTKSQIWHKAVQKLNSSQQFKSRKYCQKQRFLWKFLSFSTFYSFQQQSLKVSDELKYIVINENDIFFKIISIIINLINQIQVENINFLLNYLKQILESIYSLDPENRTVLQSIKKQFDNKKFISNLIQILASDTNYQQKIRFKSIQIIKLILYNVNCQINHQIQINFIKILSKQLYYSINHQYYSAQNIHNKTSCLQMLLQIIQQLIKKPNSKIPLNKTIIIKDSKYCCLINLTDFIIQSNLRIQILEIHKTILDIINKYIIDGVDSCDYQKLQKSKLIINQETYFRGLKKLIAYDEQKIKLKRYLEKLLTVIVQNIFSRKKNLNYLKFLEEEQGSIQKPKKSFFNIF